MSEVANQFTSETFSNRLRELMEDFNGKKITQQQLAAAIGVKRQTISQYMEGNVEPVISKLAAIARYFCVSSDWLLGLSDTKNLMYNDLHQKIGISEKALELMHEHYSIPYTKKPLEFFLSSPDFYTVIKAIAYLANVYVDPDSAQDILHVAAAKYLVTNEFNNLIDRTFAQKQEHPYATNGSPKYPFSNEEVMKNGKA